MKSQLIKILKVIIPVFLLGFLLFTLLQNWLAVSLYISNVSLPPLVVSFSFTLLVYPQAAFAWFRIVQLFQPDAKLTQVLKIWIISNTSRYIPGTIWQYVGRVALTKKIGIAKSTTVLTLCYEVLLAVLAAGTWSVLVFIFLPLLPFEVNSVPVIIMLFISAFVFLHPSVAGKLLQIIQKVSKQYKLSPLDIKLLTYHQLLSVLPHFILNFLINGIALYFLAMAFGFTGSIEHIIMFSGMYALSWLVGFVSIISPGGIGVFEVVFVALFSLVVPFTLATTIALCYRFLLVVAEILTFTLQIKND